MSQQDQLKVIFLGGVGEIGKNMSLLECGDDILVIDCGIGFPENDMLGVDVVIPDYSYLVENRERIRGMVFTHGHEDHVGGFPFFLRAIGEPAFPVFAAPLTRGIIEAKLSEWDALPTADFQEVQAGDTVEVGCFTVEFIHVNHSIPAACGLGIRTPAGSVVHSGDFKIDHTPVDGKPLDVERFVAYGDGETLLLIMDATNAEKQGYVASERGVGDRMQTLFAEAEGRVIVATFASNIHRIQQVMDISSRLGRKVCVDGRSMLRNIQVASKLGYLNIPSDLRIDLADVTTYDPREVTVLTTGSQGEPMSVLVRMSEGEHKHLKTQPGDTVVLSANPIPGNEALIWRTVNNLCRQGARVIHSAIDTVHVSGHANREEMKLMISMVRPEFVLPFHGEPRHQNQVVQLAQTLGIGNERVLVLDNYEIVTLRPGKASVSGRVPGEAIMVDGMGIGDVGDAVLRDRRILSTDGVVFVTAVIDDLTGDVLDGPVVETRGFVQVSGAAELLEDAVDEVANALTEADPDDELEDIEARVRRTVQKLLRDRTGRRPMVIPVLLVVGDGEGEELEDGVN